MLQFKLLRPQTLERILYVAEQLINKNVVNAKELVQCLLQQISVSRLDESSVSFKQALWVVNFDHVFFRFFWITLWCRCLAQTLTGLCSSRTNSQVSYFSKWCVSQLNTLTIRTCDSGQSNSTFASRSGKQNQSNASRLVANSSMFSPMWANAQNWLQSCRSSVVTTTANSL